MPDIISPPRTSPDGAASDAAPRRPPAGMPAAAPLSPRPATPRRRPRRWGRLVLALLGFAIAGAIVVALLPDPVPVELARAERRPLEVTVEEDGRTRVRDRYEVAAPVAGTLLRVDLEPGDTVQRGQVLARLIAPAAPLLDPRTRAEATARVEAARDALRQARSAITRASDALAFARREAERQRALFQAGATSAQTREQAELLAETRAEELASARFGAGVAAHELQMYESALARLSGRGGGGEVLLRAPADGVVLAVRRESEGPVQPGQPLLEVGDPAALEVEVDLLTADAARVRPGTPARIERWGGPGVLRGHVHRVEPSAFTKLSALGVEEQRVNVLIDLDDPHGQWAALGDGYRVEASIRIWAAPAVLTVPASAAFRSGDGWAVFRLDGDRARLVPITIGQHTDAWAEIRRGLSPGEMVVVYPSERVRDGVRVARR
jgi:HlyD family secretion protein